MMMASASINKTGVSTPKRGNIQFRNRALWYEYYAGYSPQFALDVIEYLNVDKDSIVLDPWNGIGTTTLAASAAGCLGKGFDLNPVPIVISKALNVSVGDKQSILPLAKEIVSKATRLRKYEDNEPLSIWFGSSASSAIRSIEKSIQVCLVRQRKQDYAFIVSDTSCVSEIAAFFYLALFKTIRVLIGKFTGSNPTWVKKPKLDSDKIDYSFSFIKQCFEKEIASMLDCFNPVFESSLSGEIEVTVGDSSNIPCRSSTVDFVMSSPPYCTRIDYAVSTMPELALLGFADTKFDTLRRKLIGTTTVPSIQPFISEQWGQSCNMFLTKLKYHSSKASATYYLKNHVQYFDSLFKSISEISRVLKKEGNCVLVVQDSYYKDIHNDLPKIVSDMAYGVGLSHINSVGFLANNNMAEINPGSKKYRSSSTATESVLFFQKH
ncbi:hypothetical protein [Hymenobacter negativus]|uniref:DNA methylase N-4/N-6 domain-containing protein n=1 Tax=Hymenobacter negativus TaxID=2795026 RepID=A0ABS3QIS0_9BACT|nr:hypothetical protein [Hymenobacter negativus]MBO2010898.1 hypothetical protein [Hymenobacter negativus]